MTKKRFITALCLTLMVALVACGGSEPKVDTQATQVAAGVAATLTAQAQARPTASPAAPQTVVVVTPPPPTEPPPTATLESLATATLAPTAGVDVGNIRLEADGSGDFATLAEALAASDVGATITLGPGTFRLAEALTVAGSLRLVGAGRDQTEVISAAPEWVLRFQGDGPFTVEGITFRYDGDDAADVVAVESGEVHFQDCRFTGGVWAEESGSGSGLLLDGPVTGEVRDCQVDGNGLHGFHLRGEASLLLENNICRDNEDSGIAYFEQAGGTARSNDCSANAMHGIYVDDQAAPTLEGNTLRDNGETGIAYFGQAGGTARGNDCSANGKHGIGVEDQAAPALETNTLRDNGDSGIAYFGGAAGLARGNICSNNKYNGIYAAEGTAPTLLDNDCPLGGSAVEAVSGEGRIAFVSNRDGDAEIYAMNPDGSGMVRLTDRPGRNDEPAWSPDGTQIAFLSNADGNDEIYLMNADGSGLTRLTDDPASDTNPAWSPDGTQIAFVSDRDGDREVFVVSTDGSGLRQLSESEGQVWSPTWSPDGTRIAFVYSAGGTTDIYVMDLNNQTVRPITDDSASEDQLAWSPDGKRLAFVTDLNFPARDLYLLDVATGWQTPLLDNVGYGGSAAWSPDGKRLAVGLNGSIYVMNAGGGELTPLTDDTADDWGPAWWGPAAGVLPTGPRFNPAGDPWCYNTPEAVVAGDWQVVAPREMVLIGDSAEIGLRDKAGQSGVSYTVTARVIAPDDSEATATGTLTADQWLTLVYPDDFGSALEQRGAYTIIWEIEGNFVACDGFIVGGGAGL
jgi:parallel beta-helix repeat protein